MLALPAVLAFPKTICESLVIVALPAVAVSMKCKRSLLVMLALPAVLDSRKNVIKLLVMVALPAVNGPPPSRLEITGFQPPFNGRARKNLRGSQMFCECS